MKFLTSRCCKAVVAFVAAMSLSVNTFAASPQVVNSFYNYAKTNQISKIRRLQSMGYGIDVRTDDGISAYCLAKNDDNTQAMRLLERLGADKNQKCTTIAWGKTAAVALGVAAVGGGVALAAGGGGGGGGGDSDPCASKPNSQWFVDHCECVPGYEDPGDGICYKILTCGANQHQDKDKCVCNDGYIEQGGVCYVELTCGANAHQEGNECVCDGGYIEQGGVCYAELTCGANAHQEGNKCVCDGGYIEQGGVCYAELSCGAHGTQEGNTCKCEEGYKGSSCQECDIGYDRYGDDLCHKTLDCGQYGQQKGGTCVCYDNHVYDGTSCDNKCAEGYERQEDGSCLKVLDCGEHGESVGGQCVCKDGYAWDGTTCDNKCAGDYHMGDDGVCYAKLTCGNHGSQVNDQCVCETGYAWDGTTCDKQCDKDYIMGTDGVCYTDLKCGEHGKQVLDQCRCDAGYGRDASGACVEKNVVDKVGFEENANHNDGEVKIENNDFVDVYGMKSTFPAEDWVGSDSSLYNRHAKVDAGVTTGEWHSLIDITNNSDANVYGMYSELSGGIYNLYVNIEKDIKGEITAAINIKNHGNGNVYGIRGNNNVYNLYGDIGVDLELMKVSSSINVENDGSGTAYGMYGKTADNSGDYESAVITVKSTYDYMKDALSMSASGGDVYGLYATSIATNNGGRIDVSSVSGDAIGMSSNNTADNSGNITSTSVTGNATGMVGENVRHSGTMTVSSEKGSAYGISASGTGVTVKEKAQIDVSSKSQDNTDAAYGVYAKGGSVEIENGVQSIGITSEAGNAYGVYAINGTTITNAFGLETPEEGEANEPAKGIVVTSTSGEAYGLYGNSGNITNNGKVDVNGGKAAYGIKGEGGSITVTNSGSVLSHSDGGDAYGMHSENKASNSGTIEVSSVSGNAVGMVGAGVNNTGILNVSSTENNVYGLQWHEVLMSILNPGTNKGTINVSGNNDTYGYYASGAISASFVNETGGVIIGNNTSGNLYGVYAGNETSVNNPSHKNEGTIELTATTGNVYGMYGENVTLDNTSGEESSTAGGVEGTVVSDQGIVVASTLGEAYGMYGKNSVITNSGKIAVNGGSAAYGIKAEENSSVANSGNIEVYTSETGNAYGLYLLNGSYTGDGSGNIKVTGTGIGHSYGVYYDGETSLNFNSGMDISNKEGNAYGIYANQGGITFTGGNESFSVMSTGSGNAYGMYGNGGTLANNAISDYVLNVSSSGSGHAYGMYANGGSVTTDAGSMLQVNNTGTGDAYGIYGIGADINNRGDITVSASDAGNAYGIYADGGSVNNSGTITVDGNTAYGIYATNGAMVTNTGTITLNGTSCGDCDGGASNGNYIVLAEGSTLVNASLMSVAGDFDFDDYGSSFRMGKGGVVEASGDVSGTAAVEASVVQGGFEDEYREEGAIKGQNLGVAAASQSAMFEASIEEGEDGAADIVMKRESFNNLSSASSIAAYLEQNYKAEKNEQLFDALKSAPNAASYRSAEAELLGYGLLPNFSRENMTVLRSLNNALNKELFTAEGKERKMVGYDFLYQARDTKGTLTGYENYANTMYFMYDNEHENGLRSGLGMSITQFNSNYDDDSSRKEIMIQALVPISYKAENGLKWASVARFGYGDGEYKRRTSSDVFESDLSEWIYGLSNAVRYKMDLGFVKVEPTAEFNVLGYYQNRIREDKNKANAIKADAVNNLSVEGGLGFNLSKEWKLNERDKLSVHAGAMYYHEFAEPYHSLDASIYGMTGSYRITDYEGIYDDDRGVLSAGFDYDIGDFTIYGQYNQYIEDENPMSINAGLKYRF